LGGTLSQKLGIRVANGGELGTGVELKARHMVKIADLTSADDGDTNRGRLGFGHDRGVFLRKV
jgi:hypothetical protein